jgi:hypothetical protein
MSEGHRSNLLAAFYHRTSEVKSDSSVSEPPRAMAEFYILEVGLSFEKVTKKIG